MDSGATQYEPATYQHQHFDNLLKSLMTILNTTSLTPLTPAPEIS